MNRNYVIFDMDGVLFDSEMAYINGYRTLLQRDGYVFCEQASIESIGANCDRTKEIFHHYYGEDFDFERYHAEVRDLVWRTPFELKLGAIEILAFLRKQCVPTALASSTREEMVLKMLDSKGLTDYFEVIVCGDMVSHSKPHPEIFLTAAYRLGAEPRDCFVIEDSFNGIRAAHAAGMRPIMVPDLIQPDNEISALAEVVLPNLFEAMTYIDERIR